MMVDAERSAPTTETTAAPDGSKPGRATAIAESVLLALVALLAAWSGFAAAKWSTDSRLALAKASTARTEASQAYLDASENRNFDASTFNTWFIAYTADDQPAMDLAARRFRPEFHVAFDAWLATSPKTNPDAPPGPTYMAEYVQPERARGDDLSKQADDHYDQGAESGDTADQYVRITVLLASILFIVGISSHVVVKAARHVLIGVACLIVAYGVVLLIAAPKPSL